MKKCIINVSFRKDRNSKKQEGKFLLESSKNFSQNDILFILGSCNVMLKSFGEGNPLHYCYEVGGNSLQTLMEGFTEYAGKEHDITVTPTSGNIDNIETYEYSVVSGKVG